MRRLPLLLAFVSALSFAQGDEEGAPPAPAPMPTPPKAKKKAAPKLTFPTNKPWAAARWYAVGKWVQSNGIRWLGGEAATRIPFPAECLSTTGPYAGTLARTAEGQGENEILTSGEWIAIELSPNVQEEEITFKSRAFASNPKCQARAPLSYAWSKDGGKITPLLLLSATGSRFYGYEINMQPPQVDDFGDAADIQLDLLLGVWPGKVPHVAAGGKSTLMFAPVAIVRGEWLPFQEYWGLTLALEQTVASFGGEANQKALFSDWQVGTFFEYFFPVMDSIQLRLGAKYKQHLADDALQSPSFLQLNKDAKYLVAASTVNFYFGKSWLIGFDIDYGMPGMLAGRSIKQGYINGIARIGFRTTASMFILIEGGMRKYTIGGMASEDVTMGQLGIRLDL